MELRMMKPVRVNKKGVWFCAGCAGRWTHAEDGAKRLFVSRCYDDDTAFVAYCNVSLSWADCHDQVGWRPAFEIQMQILKGAQLVKKIRPGCDKGTHN